jgi:ABC-type glutathione transport system ATPase component
MLHVFLAGCIPLVLTLGASRSSHRRVVSNGRSRQRVVAASTGTRQPAAGCIHHHGQRTRSAGGHAVSALRAPCFCSNRARPANHSTTINLLNIQNVAKSHDDATVFACVSFALAPDDRLAVLGASGSGKTPLLRLLAGLDSPTFGAIERIAGLRIGMVFQDLALWPNLSALDNVALALPDVPRSQHQETARAGFQPAP